jgi:hypothetical protein
MVASPGPRPWIGLVISRHVGSRRHRGEYAVVHSAGRWTPHARLRTCQLAPVRASSAMRTTSSRATGASAAAITASVRSAAIRFESKVTEVLQSVLDTESTPELVPSGEEEELQSSEANVGSFALRDFSLFQVLRYGFRPRRSGFWRGTPGAIPTGATGRGDFQTTSDPPIHSRRFVTGCRSSCGGSTRSVSSSAPRCPTGPRCRTAVLEQVVHRPLSGRIVGDFDVASRGRRAQLVEVVARLLGVCIRPLPDRVVHGVVGANVSP